MFAARHYAAEYGQGFPLVDRLIDAVVQAPLTSPLTGAPTLQTMARRMLTWLDVETTTCPHVAWTENGKYHVVDQSKPTHTLCNRQIIERPYYKLDLTPWHVGVKRGVWQIALRESSACSYCARNPKIAAIPMLAETSEFDVLDQFSVNHHVDQATERVVSELVATKDELAGGSAISQLIWKTVRETIFFGLTETAVSRALAHMADDRAWIGHSWVKPDEPNYSKRELLWQIETWKIDANAMSDAVRAAGHEHLFREGPGVSEDTLEKEWLNEVGLALVRRCWPAYSWA